MIVTNYNINGLNFSVIYENERVIIYMDVNKEIKVNKRAKDEERVIYMDVNKEIKNGILRKLIICNTKISSYICNAIVEITTKNIYEDLLLNLYNEVLEVSEMVI
ncbi:hypothetical protein SULI_09620 [Saccharolobus solfataricus]|uniref:Uncharacterized protein n=3 Tax=Saccharolobus solfataricus TaxID=2287 RepID=Q97ZK5_SACS2|nr:hypothetical protein [Saccharolobus solfataricus]AAK41183.1 Hypothetical protein SSO0902 [Saccharolobus solfataricus P2]AKA74136.1 hypothetical protein SULB_1914 [Saccharolobus solfataricus]AKA76834.1 hypothetical protein SULC_1912 [Saccharolobus solfataricus]AKA79527.1 hypothetical protein SULA_1913 [Saccharolobus solfataricus]AZF68615.1 hypothetical protein SULG_09620 [Saccharolobus solfataricus]